MADNPQVKFVRIRGKIVPIKVKPGEQVNKGKLKSDSAKYLEQRGKEDKGMARTGRKVGGFFTAAGAVGAGIAALGKTSGTKKLGLVGAGIGGTLGLINFSFASGREASGNEYKRHAKDLKAGKKVSASKYIGPAPERAYQDAVFLQKQLNGKVKVKKRK